MFVDDLCRLNPTKRRQQQLQRVDSRMRSSQSQPRLNLLSSSSSLLASWFSTLSYMSSSALLLSLGDNSITIFSHYGWDNSLSSLWLILFLWIIYATIDLWGSWIRSFLHWQRFNHYHYCWGYASASSNYDCHGWDHSCPNKALALIIIHIITTAMDLPFIHVWSSQVDELIRWPSKVEP